MVNSRKRAKPGAGEIERRFRVVPSSLDIYLTNACNMRCRYCASGSFIKRGGVKTLPLEQILKAVDLFASCVNPQLCQKTGDPAPIREVSFTGGEPLLHFDVLKKAVSRIKKKYKWLKITVFTNGTLLDAEKSGFFLENDVRLIVSLDGKKAVNDRHRRFQKGRSAFETVVANIKRLPRTQISAIHLMATFTSETVGSLIETVELFKTFKCRDIHLGLDLYENWSASGLKLLRSALSGFRKYCLRTISPCPGVCGQWDFNFYFKDRVSACQDLTPSNSFTLSPDGYFYPCDELCIAGASRHEYSVGDVDSGLDFDKLEKLYNDVSSYISRYDRVNGVLSPIDRYYRAVLNKQDPACALRNSGRVTDIFIEELGGLIEVERIFKRLAHDAGFGDFLHEPRRSSGTQIKALRFGGGSPAGNRSAALGKAREALDYFLYSPCAQKELVFKNGGDGFYDAAQGLIVYSILKAGALGKRLKVKLENGCGFAGSAGPGVRL